MHTNVLSSNGSLWIEPDGRVDLRQRLHIKGANWAGFQSDGCPHALWSYGGKTYSVKDYVDFLELHRFNAVRLPLSAPLVNENSFVGVSCGAAYHGMQTLDVLDDVLVSIGC